MRPGGGRELAAAGALFAALTAAYLGPAMSWGLAGRLGPDHGDPVFYVYLLKWIASRLPHGLAGVWDPPFFHPATGALALSDHFLGPGLAFALLRGLGLAPLSAYNLLYASAFLFAGASCWWVLRRTGLSFWAAVLGASFFAFGHFRWDEQSHFNVLRTAWIPLVLWSFDRLLERPGWRRAGAFALAYAGHLAGAMYLAYLVHLPLAVLVLVRRRELLALRAEPRRALPLAAAAAFALALLGALYLAYAGPVEAFGARRELAELRANSPVLRSFAVASYGAPILRALPFLAGPPQRGALFAGFVILAAGAVALADGWRRHRRPMVRRSTLARAVSLAALAAIAGGLLAADRFTLDGEPRLGGYLGPLLIVAAGAAAALATQRWLRGGRVLETSAIGAHRGLLASSAAALAGCLPLFFWPLWSTLPGMSGMRIPQRLFPFAALGIGWAAGRGLDLLRQTLAERPRALRAAAVAALLAAAALEQAPRLRPWAPLPEAADFPGYARYLAETSEVAVYAELPIHGDWRDLRAMYFQTLHWKPLVNGYSSFLTRDLTALADRCRLLSATCLDAMSATGVTHLVVQQVPVPEQRLGKHRRKVDRLRLEDRTLSRVDDLVTAGRLELVFPSEPANVYRLAPGAAR